MLFKMANVLPGHSVGIPTAFPAVIFRTISGLPKSFWMILLLSFVFSANSCGSNNSRINPNEKEKPGTTNTDSQKPNRAFNHDFLIVGTLNDIKFEELEWKSITFRYSFYTSKKSYLSREITIDDEELIKQLNSAFSTKSVEANSTANQPRLVLTLSDGRLWDMDTIHPNRIACCQTDNNKKACTITLNDTRFYDKLREICLDHEKTMTPDARIENIMVCYGALNNDVIETIVPYSANKSKAK